MGNVLEGTTALIVDGQTLIEDMRGLLRQNGCQAAVTRRFQDNLKRFARSEQPLRVAGSYKPSAVTDPIPGIPFRDQNYERLVDDLLLANSRTWMFAYERGSAHDVSVTSRDEAGRPSQISARYTFRGMSSATTGIVTISFSGGLPSCLNFPETPGCKTPDHKIVAAYAEEGYRQ